MNVSEKNSGLAQDQQADSMTKSILVSCLLILAVAIAGCGDRSSGHVSMATPAAPDSAEPHLAVAPDGRVVLSWLEQQANGTALVYSELVKNNWAESHTVATGEDWFVNWADFPSVMPLTDDLWAAHWLVRSSDVSFAYDVVISTSKDGGATWSDPLMPHRDGTATEHGFVSLYPYDNGTGAIWLDGRNMTESETGHGAGGMTLRSAVINEAGQITNERLVDDLVCDCCQTDVAQTSTGPIVVYRNRTSEEIRDTYVARLVNGEWQPGKAVGDDGWKIAGCPVNGPAISASGSHVAVAWFTAANDAPRTRFAWSDDLAVSFTEPVDVEVTKPIGRVDVELLSDDDAAVSWLRAGSDGQGEICVRRVSRSGELGPEYVVATTTTARMSGFPQMVYSDDQLVFAWTDTSGSSSTVKSAFLEIGALP